MKLESGPLFGALIIGCGIGYLVGTRTNNIFYGLSSALALTVADYYLILWTNSFRKK